MGSPVGGGMMGMRQWLFGMYFQDDWKANSRLALNLGVRYEFATVAREVNGRTENLRHQLDPQITLGAPWYINPSLKTSRRE